MFNNYSYKQLLIQSIIILSIFINLYVCLNATPHVTKHSINEIYKLLPDSTIIENKVTYVDFWASWCVPCRKSFPWMKEMLATYGDSGLVIITISVDKDQNAAQNFLQAHNLQSINIFDPDGRIATTFEIEVMPTSFVYDKSGKFIFKHEGFLNKDTEKIENELLLILRGGDVEDQ